MPRAAVLSIYRKRGTEAYFSKRALECLWNKISSSPTPIPKRIWREMMSAHSLPVEFSRFACENKLTLSVFVNMSYKFRKHIPKRKIICLPSFRFRILQAYDCCRSSPANIGRTYAAPWHTLFCFDILPDWFLLPRTNLTQPSVRFRALSAEKNWQGTSRSWRTCLTTVDLPIWRGPITTWMNFLGSFSLFVIVWYSARLYISLHFTQQDEYFYSV